MSFWSDDDRRENARRRFERAMAVPMLVAASLLAVVTLTLIFGDLDKGARRTLLLVDVLLWMFFVFDYVARLSLSTARRQFVRDEWLDLLLVVLPLLQPLRVVGAIVRVARSGIAIERTVRSAQAILGRHRLDIALAWAAGLMLVAGVVVPVVEPDSSKIKDFGDGMWWAIVTTTTVGYGDMVPESGTGKFIAAFLMFAGIGIIGLLTANIASLFITPDEPDDADRADTEPDNDHQARLDELDAKLDELIRRLDAGGGPP